MKFVNQAEEAADTILQAFETPELLPEPLALIFIHRSDGSPCRSWSWRNQLIVALHGHSDARGYRQWEQVGRRVKKGEVAFRILSPLARKVLDEKTEKERLCVYGYRGTPVFGYDQTEGDPLPASGDTETWLETLPLREVAEEWGLSVAAFEVSGGKALGVYHLGQSISLGVENLSVWCHELVHAADDRCGTLNTSRIVECEVVAELGGAILLRLLGHEVPQDLGGSWRYLRRMTGGDKEATLAFCGEVIDRTCSAVSLILETAEDVRARQECSVAPT